MLQIWETYRRCLWRGAMQSWMLNHQLCAASWPRLLKHRRRLHQFSFEISIFPYWLFCGKPVFILIHLFRCNQTHRFNEGIHKFFRKQNGKTIDCAWSISTLITLLDEYIVTISDITIVILSKSISFLFFMLGAVCIYITLKFNNIQFDTRCAQSVIKVFIQEHSFNSQFLCWLIVYKTSSDISNFNHRFILMHSFRHSNNSLRDLWHVLYYMHNLKLLIIRLIAVTSHHI